MMSNFDVYKNLQQLNSSLYKLVHSVLWQGESLNRLFYIFGIWRILQLYFYCRVVMCSQYNFSYRIETVSRLKLEKYGSHLIKKYKRHYL